jgi:hypothetical protein
MADDGTVERVAKRTLVNRLIGYGHSPAIAEAEATYLLSQNHHKQAAFADATAAIAALEAEGWRKIGKDEVVVPVEPDDAFIERLGKLMHSAEHSRSGEDWPVARSFYRAMLAAAKEPST